MTILFVILIIVSSLILALIVLIQNPKGGGLAGNIAGFSTQFMGVKQTTDVLEKGTWIFASIIGVLCIASAFFLTGGSAAATNSKAGDATIPVTTQPTNQPIQQQLPPNTVTLPDSQPK